MTRHRCTAVAARSARGCVLAVAGLALAWASAGCRPNETSTPAGSPAPQAPQASQARPASAPALEPADGSREAPRPPTVVSLDPLATRLVLALGAGGQLAAVDAASAQALPELAEVARTDLARALHFEPTLVLTATLDATASAQAQQLRAAGVRVIELAPHDLEEVAAAIREIGSLLVGDVRAMRFETELTRPLAAIGGASFGQPRPRTLAVVGFDPLEVAGGHSFETDLIEIAGGQSVTHPGEEWRRTLAPDSWRDLAPDLVLVVAADEPTEEARAAARAALPADVPVEFFAFEGPAFWLGDPTEPARRLRAIVERHARALTPAR